MANGRPGRKAGKRHPDWSKETVLRELRDGKSVADVLAQYHMPKGAKQTALFQEIVRWRAADAEFDRQYGEILDERGVNRGGGALSKEMKDPSIADWRLKFCEDLFESGKMLTAAERSPFCWEEIVKKLNKNTPSYDESFAELVQQVRMKLCAEMEGGFVEAFRESSGKDKAWIARSWLERQDPTRWSKQVELIHSGTTKVEHTHVHKLELPKEQRLAALAGEQAKFFAESSPSLALEAGDVIEAEVVEST